MRVDAARERARRSASRSGEGGVGMMDYGGVGARGMGRGGNGGFNGEWKGAGKVADGQGGCEGGGAGSRVEARDNVSGADMKVGNDFAQLAELQCSRGWVTQGGWVLAGELRRLGVRRCP